jgi:hypothetical protein
MTNRPAPTVQTGSLRTGIGGSSRARHSTEKPQHRASACVLWLDLFAISHSSGSRRIGTSTRPGLLSDAYRVQSIVPMGQAVSSPMAAPELTEFLTAEFGWSLHVLTAEDACLEDRALQPLEDRRMTSGENRSGVVAALDAGICQVFCA